MISRNEKSIIDYIIINRKYRHEITDVKVRRGPEINSDHYLLMAKTKSGSISSNNKPVPQPNIMKEAIEIYRLSDKYVAQKYTQRIKSLLSSEGRQSLWLVEQWEVVKNALIRAGKEVSGITKINRTQKHTAWWNAEIRQENKLKEEIWKQYQQHKTNDKYQEYKLQHNKVKLIIREDFGRKLVERFPYESKAVL